MAESSIMVSLSQMLDLALASPEVGAVNFNILHSLLHVLLHQTELKNCTVEFRGNDSDRIQALMATTKSGPTLTLTEYTIDPNGEIKPKEKDENAEEQLETVVYVEPVSKPEQTRISVAVSRDHFVKLEKEVSKIKDKINELIEMPTNMGLVDAVRGQNAEMTPVVEMWQILNLSKRVDAAETGMSKLASMMEDFIRERPDDAFFPRTDSKDSDMSQGKNTATSSTEDMGMHQSGSVMGMINEIRDRVIKIEKKMRKIGKGSLGTSSSGGLPVDTADASPDLEQLKKNINAAKEFIEKLLQAELNPDRIAQAVKDLEVIKGKLGVPGEQPPAPDEQRITDLEARYCNCEDQMSNLDSMFNNQVNILQQQFAALEKELGLVVEKINTGIPGGDSEGGGSLELYNKINALEAELENINATTALFMEEKEEREMHMNVIREQIELLKTIKADREDLEDALADKADQQQVNRKVSHDQFDAACDDLSRNVDEALKKLTQQETIWHQALDSIQREIENKLDKMELTPLRDFVNHKLHMLQERLKALAALKKEQEAAGTKSKFLRNVNCISCDKDVIMRKEEDVPPVPGREGLQPTRSMRPYLAYELDEIRKHKKCLPHGRNLNYLESAVQEEKRKEKVEKEKIPASQHLCNRYCGGSHTTTTPHQRVIRLGHFLNQWGPEAVPLGEGQVQGVDGHMYKSRDAATPRTEKGAEGAASNATQSAKAGGPAKQGGTSARLSAGSTRRSPRASVTKKGKEEDNKENVPQQASNSLMKKLSIKEIKPATDRGGESTSAESKQPSESVIEPNTSA